MLRSVVQTFSDGLVTIDVFFEDSSCVSKRWRPKDRVDSYTDEDWNRCVNRHVLEAIRYKEHADKQEGS